MKLQQAIRRPFRISLLTLLILVTIAAVLMGMASYELKRERNAVAALRDTGLYVYYDYERPGRSKKKPPPPSSKWQRWFRNMVGEDYFHPVVVIRGYGSHRTTDADLAHLSSLPDLEEIYLFRTPITDDGLRFLSSCSKLTRLELAQVPITNEGLSHVAKVNSLQRLKLSCTEITDDGLKHLGRLKSLNRLVLAHNRMIKGEGFVYLRRLQGLRTLELEDVPINDACLAHIEQQTSLRRLILNRTLVTDAGVARLQAALPSCRIEFED